VTKFEFPITKDMKITIEKGTQGFSNSWFIRNMDTQIFDRTEFKFTLPHFTQYSPNRCYMTLENAFRMTELIIQNYGNFKIDYTGRCSRCGERVGERNLKVAFGSKVCQDCYNMID
jgi:formylmethanofuran dehydrogenase subunit E